MHIDTQRARETKGERREFKNLSQFPQREKEREREKKRLYLGVSEITGLHLASAVIWDRNGGKGGDERQRRKKNIVKGR